MRRLGPAVVVCSMGLRGRRVGAAAVCGGRAWFVRQTLAGELGSQLSLGLLVPVFVALSLRVVR